MNPFAGIFFLVFATAAPDGSWQRQYAYQKEVWRDCNAVRAEIVEHFSRADRDADSEGVLIVDPQCVAQKPKWWTERRR